MSQQSPRRRCTCRGECGSRRCIAGHMLGRLPCNVPERVPHPVTGQQVRLTGDRCQLCHKALVATQQARRRRAAAITAPDGINVSLFSLVSGGGFSC